MVSLSKKAPQPVKASVWYTACTIFQKMVSLLLVPMYVRLMTTEEYGTYTLALSWENIVLVFTTLNLASYAFNNCLIREEKSKERVTGAFLGLLLIMTTICSTIFLLFIDFWERVFGLEGKYIIAIALDSFFIVAIDIWYARKKFDYSYRGVAIVTATISLINLMAGVYFVVNSSEKAFTAIVVGLGARGIVTLILAVDIWRRGRCFFDRELWKYALCFNVPLIPHFLSARVLQQADRVMIRKYCGIAEAGIYGFSYKISETMLIFNSALLASVIPWTYRKLKEEKYGDIFQKIYLTMVLIGGINIVLILLAPEIVGILGTSEYKEAVYVIPPVACSTYLMYLFNCFANITYYYGENKKVMWASVIAAILNLFLNRVFIPRYGYLAAGFTTLVSYICLAVMHGIMYKKTLKDNGITESVYNIPIILLSSTLLIIFGLSMVFSYKSMLLRYAVILLGAGLVFLKRRWLVKVYKELR